MGKGDKKTKKGKISKGSFGNSRKRNAIRVKMKGVPPKKADEPVAAEAETPVKRRTVKKKSEA